jgi:hypothetical protein
MSTPSLTPRFLILDYRPAHKPPTEDVWSRSIRQLMAMPIAPRNSTTHVIDHPPLGQAYLMADPQHLEALAPLLPNPETRVQRLLVHRLEALGTTAGMEAIRCRVRLLQAPLPHGATTQIWHVALLGLAGSTHSVVETSAQAEAIHHMVVGLLEELNIPFSPLAANPPPAEDLASWVHAEPSLEGAYAAFQAVLQAQQLDAVLAAAEPLARPRRPRL